MMNNYNCGCMDGPNYKNCSTMLLQSKKNRKSLHKKITKKEI